MSTSGLPTPAVVSATATTVGATVSWQVADTQGDAGNDVARDDREDGDDRHRRGPDYSGTDVIVNLPAGQHVEVSVLSRDYTGAASAPAPSDCRVPTHRGHLLSRQGRLRRRRHVSATLTLIPTSNTDRQWRCNGVRTDLHTTSATVAVTVAPQTTAAVSRTFAPLGPTVVVTGTVAPDHHGQPVYPQRYYGGRAHRRQLPVTHLRDRFSVRPSARNLPLPRQ